MQVAPTVEMKASDNPALQNVEPDPTIFCSAFKKNRFYLVRQKGIHFKVTALHFFLSYYKFFVVSFWSFRRENQRIPRAPIPTETSLTRSPQKKRWWPPRRPRAPRECLTVPSSTPLWETSTSSFSLWSKSSVWMLLAPPFTLEDRNRTFPLFGFRCPKTVENFCVHSRNGYYNGHIFHRVIKVRCPFSLWSLYVVLFLYEAWRSTVGFWLWVFFSLSLTGLHDSDWRPHRNRHGRREHLGRGVWRRVPRHAETRPPIHT